MANSNPLHLLYVLFLVIHVPTTLLIDAQSGEMGGSRRRKLSIFDLLACSHQLVQDLFDHDNGTSCSDPSV